MSSEPKESPKSERLPFEPGRKKSTQEDKSASKSSPKAERSTTEKAKAGKTPAKAPIKGEKASTSPKASAKPTSQKSRQTAAIPDIVSKRMARRMAVFCGIPTSFGMVTFVVSYIVVTRGIFKLPNVAVLLVSMGFFGLGVLGLSYGFLSASWDEEQVGSLLGFEEFRTNFGRITGAWKEARNQKSQTPES
jgi:hypothetical protein